MSQLPVPKEIRKFADFEEDLRRDPRLKSELAGYLTYPAEAARVSRPSHFHFVQFGSRSIRLRTVNECPDEVTEETVRAPEQGNGEPDHRTSAIIREPISSVSEAMKNYDDSGNAP
jgi:hypothetical protein